MDYEPSKWQRLHLYRGFFFMFMGVLCYVAATYVIFLLESTALQIVLGISALAFSVLLIAAGFSSSNTKRHVQQRSYSDAVRSTRAHNLVSSAGALSRKSDPG